MLIPKVVIERLPQYLRALTHLLEQGNEVISSQQLGEVLQVTPAQIRKDFSYFGRFGKQGRGYNIAHLMDRLRNILGLDRTWNVAVVGIGRLGRAIISYPGFTPEGFRLARAFDTDPSVVGQTAGGLVVQPMSQLAQSLAREQIRIAIVAVPAPYAQQVVDQLVECGIKSILSYAPIATQSPHDIQVHNIDPVLALQSMTYYLSTTKSASASAAAVWRDMEASS
jgi:redox-sensing transcriptional repressor